MADLIRPCPILHGQCVHELYHNCIIRLCKSFFFDGILPLPHLGGVRYLRTMPKKESRATKAGKLARTIYLSKDIGRRLEKAALAEGMTRSIYIEQTLKARFKKDAIE